MPAPSTFPGQEVHATIGAEAPEATPKLPLSAEHIEMDPTGASATQKTRYLQTLKLWSGTPDAGILTVLIRPLPTLAYPAVLWAIVGCE